jgi:hypothetical protein
MLFTLSTYKILKHLMFRKNLFKDRNYFTNTFLYDELPPSTCSLQGHSSRLAALDYTVCVQSEVFVTTQGGNFPHFVMGHRRYLFGGNAKTIKPDKRKLVLSFDDPNIRLVFCSHDSFNQ